MSNLLAGGRTACLFFGAGAWGKRVIEAFVAEGVEPVGFLVYGSAHSTDWLFNRFPGVPVANTLAQLTVPAACAAIATPRATHSALATEALSRGLDVLVEKPISTDPLVAQQLAADADTRGLALITGFTYLHHPAFEVLTGQVFTEIRVDWNRPGLSGPVEWELLPHDIAVALALTGAPTTAVGFAGGGNQCTLEWHSPASVHISLDTDAARPKSRRVSLSSAAGEWRWIDNALIAPDNTTTVFNPRDPLRREVRWFLAHRNVASRAAVRADVARSVAVTELIASVVTGSRTRASSHE